MNIIVGLGILLLVVLLAKGLLASVNKDATGLAVAAIVIGFGLQLFDGMEYYSTMIIKGATFVLIVLLAIRVLKSITGR